jgi:4-hydroxymandelate oxidase
MIAPSGRQCLFHPDGERAMARGAAGAGAMLVLSTYSTVTIEDVAGALDGFPAWFQLYFMPERRISEQLIDRAAAANYRAIVVTVDPPYGWSPRSARLPVPVMEHIRHVNLPDAPLARTAYDTSVQNVVVANSNLADLEWLVSRSALDVIVKGVLRGDDARRCVDAGAKAIIVSNHGGRHLDTAIATANALPDVVATVGADAEVYVDGGIRRGTDVVKALSLGAKAVLCGRPPLWGLAANGAAGVSDVMNHLNEELKRTMMLCGLSNLQDLTPDLVEAQR